MKRTKYSILFLVLFLVGCQATPISNIEDSNSDVGIIPEHIESSVTKGFTSLKIDAEIMAPDNSDFVTCTTRIQNFQQEEIDRIIDHLFGDIDLYDVDYTQPFVNFTKDELAEAIIDAKHSLSNTDDEMSKAVIMDSISQYEQAYAIAVNSLEDRAKSDKTLKLDQYGQSSLGVISAKRDDNKYSVLSITDNFLGYYLYDSPDMKGSGDYIEYSGVNPKNNTVEGLPLSEAETIVDNFFSNVSCMGLQLKTCEIIPFYIGDEKLWDAYKFTYVYAVDNISVDNTKVVYENSFYGDANSIPIKEEEYAPFTGLIDPETIEIFVTTNGIDKIRWSNRNSQFVDDGVKSKLLNFNDVLRKAEKHFFNSRVGTKDNKYSAEIKKISFRYVIIPKKNDVKNFSVVPAWDFIGEESYQELDNFKEQRMSSMGDVIGIYHNAEQSVYDQFNYSLMTINAIDGSVIY